MAEEPSDWGLYKIVGAKCGTCEHTHSPMAACVVCGCELFYAHAEVHEHIEALEHEELVGFEGRKPLLPTGIRYAIESSMRAVDEKLATQWSVAPALMVVQAHEIDGMVFITLAELTLSWDKVLHPIDALEGLSRDARESPSFFVTEVLPELGIEEPSQRPVLAWAFVNDGEASLARTGQAKVTEQVRALLGMDVDMRCYQVFRINRPDTPAKFMVETPQQFHQRYAGLLAKMRVNPADLTMDPEETQPLPRVNACLRRLLRTTTPYAMETEVMARLLRIQRGQS